MIRKTNYITLLLFMIVVILFVGVGVAIYYVFDLDWFEKKPIDIYNELDIHDENIKLPTNNKEIKYDISKRTYNLLLQTEELKVVVYKDGTVGVTMLDSELNNQVKVYKEIINKEVKLELNNIVRAYCVQVSNNSNNRILLLDGEGNLYKIIGRELMENAKYQVQKIEGVADIIDVSQITNELVTDNSNVINVIAIDKNSNEILLTNYIL